MMEFVRKHACPVYYSHGLEVTVLCVRFQENELCGLFSENESKRARSNKGLKAKAREIKAKVLCEVSE
jgi:hypothetical protein